MNKFFFLSILFIFLIFISGCVQQEDDENGDDVPIFYFGQGRGLTITNYTSTRLSLRLKESAELKINFKNIGDFEAKNIAAIIYGYGELEIISEKPHIVEILPGLEDFMFWILKAEELGSAITSYQINSRIYYDYQFEGYEQVSFIPEDHIGDAPTISRVNERSPLVLEIQSGSPIRTIFCEKTVILKQFVMTE